MSWMPSDSAAVHANARSSADGQGRRSCSERKRNWRKVSRLAGSANAAGAASVARCGTPTMRKTPRHTHSSTSPTGVRRAGHATQSSR
jgi:hypothetical protein